MLSKPAAAGIAKAFSSSNKSRSAAQHSSAQVESSTRLLILEAGHEQRIYPNCCVDDAQQHPQQNIPFAMKAHPTKAYRAADAACAVA
jgi:hypothetical protein